MFRYVLVAALTVASTASLASPQIEALARCVGESTSGKDRKDLAKWLFVAMAAHPEMKAISTVEQAASESTSRVAGNLLTRLLAEACPSQVKSAMQTGGSLAIQAAFQTLGQLAMQELMADKSVLEAMSVIERFIDRQRIDAVSR